MDAIRARAQETVPEVNTGIYFPDFKQISYSNHILFVQLLMSVLMTVIATRMHSVGKVGSNALVKMDFKETGKAAGGKTPSAQILLVHLNALVKTDFM